MLKVLKKGEGGNTAIEISGEQVTKHHKTSHDSLPKGAGFQLTWKFNFAGVTREQLLRLATETMCISLRPKFKHYGFDDDGRFVATDEQMSEWDGFTFD